MTLPEDIRAMSFSDIVALANEPNTPSGAHESIRTILVNIPTGRIRQVLDVGCNTGFATIELASWLDAKVTGIDLNEESLRHATEKAQKAALSNVTFMRGNLLDLPFDDEQFDMVYCNNVTSFVADRAKASEEYARVLRPGGILAAVPIYYCETPPQDLVKRVSEAIQAPIVVRDKQQWIECFSRDGFDLFFERSFRYDLRSDADIASYANAIASRSRLPDLSESHIDAVRDRLIELYSLFNENLRYAGFSVLLFRLKQPNSDRILHTSYAVSHEYAE